MALIKEKKEKSRSRWIDLIYLDRVVLPLNLYVYCTRTSVKNIFNN